MPYNPALQQQMAQLEQEFLQRKQNLMQNFYAQNQPQNNYQNTHPQVAEQSKSVQNVNWVYVSGIDGAKNQIVQPGQTVWMMDNNEPYFYVKAVDGVGSSSLRTFHFEEAEETTPEQSEQPQIDLSQYVPRGEFDALKEQVEQLTNKQTKPPTKANKEVDNG